MTNCWSSYIWKPAQWLLLSQTSLIWLPCVDEFQLWRPCSTNTFSHSLRRHPLWSHSGFRAYNEVLIYGAVFGEFWIILPFQFCHFPGCVVLPSSHSHTLSSPYFSSRLGTIYWMDPTLSPLIKPVSSQGSRLRSSLDPTQSTNTSLDSWSKFFF